MIKFKNIIFENSESDWGYKKSYVKLFKLLEVKGFNPDNINEVYLFLINELNFNPEVSSRIAILYQKNYDPDGNYQNLTPEIWVIPNVTNVSEKLMALSSFYNISPLIFKYQGGTNLGDKYVPLINLEYRKYLIDFIIINEMDNMNEVAYDIVLSKIKRSGWDYLSEGLLESYLTLNYSKLDYNVREMAFEEYNNYLMSEGHISRISKEEMLSQIGEEDTFLDLIESMEETLDDLKPIENENIVIQSKIDKLEIERYNVELGIERLLNTIDYDTDDEYSSTYSSDVDNLEEILNKIEYKIYYYSNELNENETILNKLQSELEDLKTHLEDYEGSNFKELFIEKRVEMLSDRYEENILEYLEDTLLSIDEAIDDGLIYIDEEEAIKAALRYDGILEHIDDIDVGYHIDSFGYNDEDYVMLLKLSNHENIR